MIKMILQGPHHLYDIKKRKRCELKKGTYAMKRIYVQGAPWLVSILNPTLGMPEKAYLNWYLPCHQKKQIIIDYPATFICNELVGCFVDDTPEWIKDRRSALIANEPARLSKLIAIGHYNSAALLVLTNPDPELLPLEVILELIEYTANPKVRVKIAIKTGIKKEWV